MADFNSAAIGSGQSFIQNLAMAPIQQQQAQLQNQQIGAQTQNIQAQTQQTQAAAQQQQLQNMYAKHNLEGQLLQSATPENYQQVLQTAAKSGLDVSNAPPEYDPEFIKSMQAQWLNADQQLKVYETNAQTAQQGIPGFNPQNPNGTNMPAYGVQGRPFQALKPEEQGLVSADMQTIGSMPEFNRNIDNAINLSGSGNIYSGPGSNALAAKDRALSGTLGQSLGLVGLASDKGAATTQYNNLVGQNLVENLKQQFGGRITNTDLEFMNKLQALSDKSPQEQSVILKQVKDHFNAKALTMQQEAQGIMQGNIGSMVQGGNLGQTAPGATVIPPNGAAPLSGNTPIIKSQSEYDALPAGAKYVAVGDPARTPRIKGQK